VISKARKGLGVWREWDSGRIASWIFVSDEIASAMKATCTGAEFLAMGEL
jgi:hypothetical protein